MRYREKSVWTMAFACAAALHLGLLTLIALPEQSVAKLVGGTVAVSLGPAETGTAEAPGKPETRTATPDPELTEAEEPASRDSVAPPPAEPITPPAPKAERSSDLEPAPVPDPPKPSSFASETVSTEPLAEADTGQGETVTSETPSGERAGPEDGADTSELQASGPASDGITGSDLATETATSFEAGNSETDNYAGEVMRHLLRVRRPRASRAGSTYIRFELDADGHLVDIAVATSSGSKRFDREAQKVVERAVPFPPPPAGISRVFTVEIEGR